MHSYSTQLAIDAPAAQVWAVLSEVTRWPEWTPTMTKVAPVDAPSLAVRRQFNVVQPKLRPARWSVTELTPDHSFTWESRNPGVHVTAYHQIEASSAEKSSVTLRIEMSGWLAPLVALMAGKLTQEYLETEAASLKRRVENGISR